MTTALKNKRVLAAEIIATLARRHSTAVVLFHHAIAERLGLSPTDHKCLDLLRERGTITGSELAGITGLTTGAITGVVARLEQMGFVRREADPHDGRKQVLRPALEQSPIHDVIAPLRKDVATMLENYDSGQLSAIAEFLTRTTDLLYHHAALLRSHTLYAARPDSAPGRGQPHREKTQTKVRA